ncbi:MAG: hypothetical protein ACTSV2_13550, partial [Candidatus Thorarchaeota archaeon]
GRDFVIVLNVLVGVLLPASGKVENVLSHLGLMGIIHQDHYERNIEYQENCENITIRIIKMEKWRARRDLNPIRVGGLKMRTCIRLYEDSINGMSNMW